MKYDLTVPVKDLGGVQIIDAIDTTGYTLRSVLVRTALHVDRAKIASVPEKLAAYALAKRIATANHFIDLSAEDVASLKEKGGSLWSPLVMGQLWEMLENPATFPPTTVMQFEGISSGPPNGVPAGN